MGLKILGAGFGRTGTQSLKLAIEALNLGPCHHMYEIRKNLALLPAWTALGQGKPADWDEMFKGFNSQVDWPGAAYWRQLADHFPDAKVILTTRDPDRWFDSMQKTIAPFMASRGTHKDAFQNEIGELIFNAIGQPIFDDRMTDRAYCTQRFLAHIDEVKSVIAPERLLVYDVKQGWDPLCKFLNVDIPAEDFPATNTSDDFNNRR